MVFIRMLSVLLFSSMLFLSRVTSVDAARKSTALYSHAPNVRDPTSQEEKILKTMTEEDGDSNENTYAWPAAQDVMILAHNSIRKEISHMKRALERLILASDKNGNDDSSDDSSSFLDLWRMESMQTWLKGHDAHIRFHCQNESDHLHPAMSERLDNFPTLKLKQDHEEIHQCLDDISTHIASSKLQTAQDVNQLLELWIHYEKTVFTHFQEEEVEGIIVSTRRAFSAKEWAPIIKAFFDLGAKEEFGSLIHAMGEDEFRNNFMRQRKIPGFVWRVAFRKNLRYYETSMVKHMEALLSGVPPQ